MPTKCQLFNIKLIFFQNIAVTSFQNVIKKTLFQFSEKMRKTSKQTQIDRNRTKYTSDISFWKQKNGDTSVVI